jgi:hypothetical protein
MELNELRCHPCSHFGNICSISHLSLISHFSISVESDIDYKKMIFSKEGKSPPLPWVRAFVHEKVKNKRIGAEPWLRSVVIPT